ncbi:MAG: DUF3887 domain-containing protein [Acidimicrobiales bacterium]
MSTTTTVVMSSTTTAAPTTTPSTAAVPAAGFSAKADQVMADLVAGRYAAITAQFDPLLATQLPTPALASAWTSYQQLLGAYQRHDPPVSVAAGGLDVERIMVTMARGAGEVRVTFHQDGTIAGLYLLKAGAPSP